MFTIVLLLLTASTPASAPRGRPLPEATLQGILGVNVGMAVADVRHRLAPLGVVDSRPTRDGGTKEVWRFKDTGFSWVAIRSAADGHVIWLTGYRRDGEEIPFDQLTSIRPNTDTDSIAIWHVEGANGQTVRVTARGRHRRAQVLTLMAEK